MNVTHPRQHRHRPRHQPAKHGTTETLRQSHHTVIVHEEGASLVVWVLIPSSSWLVCVAYVLRTRRRRVHGPTAAAHETVASAGSAGGRWAVADRRCSDDARDRAGRSPPRRPTHRWPMWPQHVMCLYEPLLASRAVCPFSRSARCRRTDC
jgi:hypothetical protein